MKRIFLLALLLLLLPACAWTKPAPTTAVPTTTEMESTSEAETTTEEPTTVFVPMSGEENGVKWRTLDVAARKNAGLLEWLDSEWHNTYNYRNYYYNRSYPLSDGKSFVEETDEGKIILRREGRSDEALLPPDDGNTYDTPVVWDLLDDRFFVFQWTGAGHAWGLSIYDLELRKTIPIWLNSHLTHYLGSGDGVIFLCDSGGGDLCQITGGIYRLDWTALRNGGEPRPVSLLESYLESYRDPLFDAPDFCTTQMLVTGGRYFLIQNERHDNLYVFDLQREKLALHLTFDERIHWYFAQRDDRTVYLHNLTGESNAPITSVLEIKLP